MEKIFKTKHILLAVLVLLLMGILALISLVVLSQDSKPTSVRITNVTDTGASVIWITNNKSEGKIVYRKKSDSKWINFPVLSQSGKEKAYDDRDVDQNKEGEFVLKKDGSQKRHTHHVTLRNLDAETEYEFRIVNNLGLIAEDKNKDTLITIKTKTISENLKTPDPAYGTIENIDSFDSVVMLGLKSADETNLVFISTPVSESSTYSIDLQPFGLTEPKATLFNLVIYSSKDEIGIHEYSSETYKPFETIIVQGVESKSEQNALSNNLISQAKAITPPCGVTCSGGKSTIVTGNTNCDSWCDHVCQIIGQTVSKCSKGVSSYEDLQNHTGKGGKISDTSGAPASQSQESATQRNGGTPSNATDAPGGGLIPVNKCKISSCEGKKFYITSLVCVDGIAHRVNNIDQSDFSCITTEKEQTCDSSENCKVIKSSDPWNQLESSLISQSRAQTSTDGIDVDESGEYSIYSGDTTGLPISEFAVNLDGRQKAQIRLFIDSNGNGVKDPGEEVLEDYSELSLKKESDAATYNLSIGWNLIALPIISDAGIDTASKLVDEFNNQGADIKHVARYTDAGFQMFTKREDGTEFSNDFNLIPGEGYFVLNFVSKEVRLAGNKFDEAVPFHTRNGWNLIGVYTNEKIYSVEQLLKDMNEEAIVADTVSKYDSGLYKSVVYEDQMLYGNSFDVNERQGYFIRVKSGGGTDTLFTPKPK